MMLANLLGVRMTLLIGPTVAVPAPYPIVDALSGVEVNLADEGRDGFQLTFTLGRGPADVADYGLLLNPLLRPFNRVVIMMWMGALPEVLIDGFITRHEVQPSNDPGASTLTVTGEDIRVMMALHEFSMAFPLMSPDVRVNLILAKYALYLAAPPVVIPPVPPIVPKLNQVPAQASTDLDYVELLARRSDYVFYVTPGPAPMVNIAYWGPMIRTGLPQSAISINVGPDSNVDHLSFSYDALAPSTVFGFMQDTDLGITLPIITLTAVQPPLSLLPAMLVQQPNVRTRLPRNTGNVSYAEAYAQAQADTNASADAVSAEGELDALRYGGLLRPRRLVGVRGAGFQYDGLYYVKRVTHRIRRGSYKQSFSLKREGLGPLTPAVIP